MRICDLKQGDIFKFKYDTDNEYWWILRVSDVPFESVKASQKALDAVNETYQRYYVDSTDAHKAMVHEVVTYLNPEWGEVSP